MSRRRSPRLTRKLILEAPVRVPDGLGGYEATWEARGTLWAELRAGTGRARADELMTVARVPYRITLRAAPVGAPSRPTPEQRLRDGARIFRILAVTEAGPGAAFLTCFAQEEVSQ